MRSIRLLAMFAAAGCGRGSDSNNPVDGHPQPHPDAPVDTAVDTAVDQPVDGPSGDATNITNLTPAANVSKHTDFTTPLFFSPDGATVGAIANFSSLDNAQSRMDAWVVPLSGTGAHRLIDSNGCGTANACDAITMGWTADSATLFVAGDLASNNVFEVFKADPAATDQALVKAAATTAGDVSNLFTVDTGAGTRVWAVGTWLTPGKTVAGGFASDATLPFDMATPPPSVVPGGNSTIFASTGATANEFDARGTKVAFVADATQTGRFDLYAAAADGSAPTLLVTGSNGIEITSVALSPDGTKVAFLMDSAAVNGARDLYVVPTDGSAAPVQVSPARAMASNALNVFFQVEWSADSKFLAFSADLNQDKFDQGYVVDTTAATPTAVELLALADIAPQTSGAQGIRGKLLFDAANNIYFRARVTANSSQFTFFKATTAGTKTAFTLPARADQSVPDIGAFAISPDGHTLVFSADSPTALTYDLYKQAL